MFSVAIMDGGNERIRKLVAELAQKGFSCSVLPYDEEAIEHLAGQDLLLIYVNGSHAGAGAWRLPLASQQERRLPVLALVAREALESAEKVGIADDFVVEPWEATEVVARARRILQQANGMDVNGLIKHGDLLINLNRYEVSIAGRLIALTFKEYELLRFLASNKGRVFTREALLDEVWGYDYYGGDRTVDVHIRRLRSKIEDATHTFIETVRNIGYRFRDNP